MAKLSVFGLCFLAALVAGQNRNRTTTSSTTSTTVAPRPSIIYGERAVEGEIPFQAALFSPIPNDPDGNGNLCGGSLIRPNWVLTAGHCVDGTDETQVGLGGTNRLSMPFQVTSTERFVHEGYQLRGPINDVALIKLPRDAEGEFISVVQTPAANSGDFVGVSVRASGFGLTENNMISNDLLKVNLETITEEECVQSYNSRNVNANVICATWVSREGESVCSGDSGGPLSTVVDGRDVLIGVSSFVHPDGCSSGRPSVYQRYTAFQEWIEQTIAANP